MIDYNCITMSLFKIFKNIEYRNIFYEASWLNRPSDYIYVETCIWVQTLWARSVIKYFHRTKADLGRCDGCWKQDSTGETEEWGKDDRQQNVHGMWG